MSANPMACPECSGQTLYLSRSAPLRSLARLVRLYPIRCGFCEARFWRFTANPPAARTRKSSRGSAAHPALPPAPSPDDTPLPAGAAGPS